MVNMCKTANSHMYRPIPGLYYMHFLGERGAIGFPVLPLHGHMLLVNEKKKTSNQKSSFLRK